MQALIQDHENTAILDDAPPPKSTLDIARVSSDTREFTGTITLHWDVARRIAEQYINQLSSDPITLTVSGEKTPGCSRFVGDITF